MSIEAMKQALEALEKVKDMAWSEDTAEGRKTMEALRAAIEQAEKPVAWITTWNEPNDKGVELHWAKQDKGASSKHTPLFYNQHKPENCEPYAWAYKTNNTWEHISFVEPPDDAYDEGSLVVLYTAPPQRSWQGLTDEDIYSVIENNIPPKLTSLFEMAEWVAKVVEAKLKDKNT